MKKTLFLAFFLLAICNGMAQESDTLTTITIERTVISDKTDEEISERSTFLKDGTSYSFIISWDKKSRRKLRSHWTGAGFSFFSYNDKHIPNSRLMSSKSYNVSLNLFDYSINIDHSNWMLVSGAGFDFHRYHFDDKMFLTKTNSITQFQQAPPELNLKSSKLVSYYLTIPLMLEYQTGSKRDQFHISAGAVGFLKYYSKSQIDYINHDGRKIKESKGRDLNLKTLDVKLRAQVGIKSVTLFGYYSPFSMFREGKGPDMKPYSLGLFVRF